MEKEALYETEVEAREVEGAELVVAGEKEVATDSVFRSRLIFATSPRSVEKSEVSRIAVVWFKEKLKREESPVRPRKSRKRIE